MRAYILQIDPRTKIYFHMKKRKIDDAIIFAETTRSCFSNTPSHRPANPSPNPNPNPKHVFGSETSWNGLNPSYFFFVRLNPCNVWLEGWVDPNFVFGSKSTYVG